MQLTVCSAFKPVMSAQRVRGKNSLYKNKICSHYLEGSQSKSKGLRQVGGFQNTSKRLYRQAEKTKTRLETEGNDTTFRRQSAY